MGFFADPCKWKWKLKYLLPNKGDVKPVTKSGQKSWWTLCLLGIFRCVKESSLRKRQRFYSIHAVGISTEANVNMWAYGKWFPGVWPKEPVYFHWIELTLGSIFDIYYNKSLRLQPDNREKYLSSTFEHASVMAVIKPPYMVSYICE